MSSGRTVARSSYGHNLRYARGTDRKLTMDKAVCSALRGRRAVFGSGSGSAAGWACAVQATGSARRCACCLRHGRSTSEFIALSQPPVRIPWSYTRLIPNSARPARAAARLTTKGETMKKIVTFAACAALATLLGGCLWWPPGGGPGGGPGGPGGGPRGYGGGPGGYGGGQGGYGGGPGPRSEIVVPHATRSV